MHVGVPICEDRSRIRMICMGNGYLTDDKILGMTLTYCQYFSNLEKLI
jgi:hypothetical protein